MPLESLNPLLLRQITLFAGLSDAALTALASRVRVRSYRRGEVLFHKDDRSCRVQPTVKVAWATLPPASSRTLTVPCAVLGSAQL